MYKKIVLATDGSTDAQRARDVAFALAKALKAHRLTIVHGTDNVPEGKRLLDETEAAARAFGIRVQSELREGAPADAVVEIADQQDANLIIVGSRGMTRAKRLLMGSVANRIAYHAPCDVLIVRAGPSADMYRRVLVATDGSATADRCARRGYDFARMLSTPVTALFVGHPRTGELILRDTHDAMEEPVETTFRMEQGDPAEKIIDVAEDEKVDLVVVGNKGITSARRFLLGSVPQRVMQYAPCDVLIARTESQALSEIAAGEAGIVRVDGRKIAVYKDDDGRVHALSAKCTHLGCTVGWNPAEKTWDCPCHGSRFAPDGSVIEGPAAQPLPKTFV